MRIELPSNTWADTLLRAEDDAHTLTIAAAPANDWHAGFWGEQPAPLLRTEVAASEPVTVTLTF